MSGERLHLVTFERREGCRVRDVAERGDDSLLGELAVLGLALRPSGSAGARRVGALLPPGPHAGDVVDLNRALAVLHALEDVGAPEAQADSLLPADPHAFLRQLARTLPAAQRALEFVAEASERYDAPDLVRAGVVLPRRCVRVAPPVPRPG